ncbi:MAG TPA: helix-turn-helix transcriptional regulator [Kineosporiaceae bacterium]|nr:helix-turn-helix transcriptional regulator [Kineosporiaceae bacterium]
MAGIGHVIANNIRAERARRRMTQADLAQAIGWPRSSIHDIEAGRRKISPDDLVALCRVFGITLTELAHGANPDDLHTLGI